MITDVKAVSIFHIEAEQPHINDKVIHTMLVNICFKIKQFSKWLNPKNWFNCFSDINIDLSEFACKKTLPKK